jgi:hypothetical protein
MRDQEIKPPTVVSVATVAAVCESERALIGFAPSFDVAVGKSADAAGISPAVVFEVERPTGCPICRRASAR